MLIILGKQRKVRVLVPEPIRASTRNVRFLVPEQVSAQFERPRGPATSWVFLFLLNFLKNGIILRVSEMNLRKRTLKPREKK